MTKQQKRFLIILGILDFIVILAMAGVVINSLRQNTPVPSEAQSIQVPICAQNILDQIPPSTQPAIIWDTSQLNLSFTIPYSQAIPPEESVQDLWMGLDVIANVITTTCPPPPTITITVIAQGTEKIHHHTAQLTGSTLTAWIQGELTESTLAEKTQYRQIVTIKQK